MKRRNLFSAALGLLAAVPVVALPKKEEPKKNNRIVLLVEFVLGEAKHFDSNTSRRWFHELAWDADCAGSDKLCDAAEEAAQRNNTPVPHEDDLERTATRSVWTLQLPSLSHVREGDVIMLFEEDKTPVLYAGSALLIAENDGYTDSDGIDAVAIEKYESRFPVNTSVRW